MDGLAVLDCQLAIVGHLASGDVLLVNGIGHQQRCAYIRGKTIGVVATCRVLFQHADDPCRGVGERSGWIEICRHGGGRSRFWIGCTFHYRVAIGGWINLLYSVGRRIPWRHVVCQIPLTGNQTLPVGAIKFGYGKGHIVPAAIGIGRQSGSRTSRINQSQTRHKFSVRANHGEMHYRWALNGDCIGAGLEDQTKSLRRIGGGVGGSGAGGSGRQHGGAGGGRIHWRHDDDGWHYHGWHYHGGRGIAAAAATGDGQRNQARRGEFGPLRRGSCLA